MKQKEKDVVVVKNWVELIQRIENRVLNSLYFHQGLFWGLFIGLAVSLWTSILYQEIFVKLPLLHKIIIFQFVTMIGIFGAIKLALEIKEFSQLSRLFKITIPKTNNYLLEMQGIKLKGMELTLTDKEMEEIYGKNWRKNRPKKDK